jgi:hypothetical protein
MHDPFARMGGFPAQLEVAVGCEVEVGASGGQLPHPCRPFLDQDLDGGRIAQGRARGQRVAAVQLG